MNKEDISDSIYKIKSLLSVLSSLDLSGIDNKLSFGLSLIVLEVLDKIKEIEKKINSLQSPA